LSRYTSQGCRHIVRVLPEQILEHRVIHVRSTPTSGKTVLSKLLHRFVQTNLPGMTIVNFSWPGNAPQDWTVKPYNWILPRVSRGVQTGGFSPGFGGKTSRSFDAKTSRKNPCVETSPEAVSLFL
jgi:hypothetical protein